MIAGLIDVIASRYLVNGIFYHKPSSTTRPDLSVGLDRNVEVKASELLNI